MNQSKINSSQALNKLWNFRKHGVKSFKNLIDEGIIIRGEIGEKPSVKWNRTKYNRMNHAEQREYEEKLNTMVKSYELYEEENIYWEVTKTVYDYYLHVQSLAAV